MGTLREGSDHDRPESVTDTNETGLEPQAGSEAAKSSRRRMLIGLGGTLLVLVVVFWFIFTFIIDPEVVVEAFLSLDLFQLAVLALMSAATYVLIGITLRNSLDGLSVKDATLGMLASLAVKGSIPGPMDTAFRFRLAIAYDYSVEDSTLSAAMLKALDWIARLLMIPIAIGILLVSGQGIAGLEWLAALGLLVSIVGIALLVGIVRSERLAKWVGDRLQDAVGWLMGRLDREPPYGLAERVMGLRQMGSTLMDTTGLLGLGLQIVIQAAWASLLTLAMAFVGIDFDVLAVSVIWASVALVYMLPIGPGFIEIAYVALFGLAIGFDDPMLDLAVAGVMIFRLFQWLIPIPIGYGLIFYWQKRDNFNLLSTESAQVQTGKPGEGNV
jgi:uncharacterized membrane protein YbhN (UPF0104 family)